MVDPFFLRLRASVERAGTGFRQSTEPPEPDRTAFSTPMFSIESGWNPSSKASSLAHSYWISVAGRASRELAKCFDVTGVELSEVMIRRAREAVPSGRFIRADMTRINLPPGPFLAVVSLYVISHVALAKQRSLMTRIHSWLGPRGLFLAVLGHEAWEGTVQRWPGVDVPMIWSHADAATYRRWLRETGFTVDRQEFVPEGDGGHELFLARKHARTAH
jgi:hypothetical protein